jgi:hypothetical protein
MKTNKIDNKGKRFEEHMLRIMSNFNDKVTSGDYFRNKSPIFLPVFNRIESNVNIPPNIEIDIIGHMSDSFLWIVEVKSRNRRAGIYEINKIINNSLQFKVSQLWFVSEKGFTIEAILLAQKKNILISDMNQIILLENYLKLSDSGSSSKEVLNV